MRIFLIALAVVSFALPAFGKTHVIKVLGTQPLFGACSSRDQLFALMRKYPERETIALHALGLDRAEFEQAMRSAQNVITGGPLHLDAMAYYWGGVKIVRDVQLPPHTKLWVSHLPRKTVYVPQLCGNISTVAVAAVGAYRAGFGVSARAPTQPGPFAGGIAPNASLATSPAAGLTPSSVVSPKAIAGIPTTGGGVPAAVHHGGFPWWIFLIPVALIHGGSGGSSGGGSHAPFIVPPVGSSSSPSPSPSPSASTLHSPSPSPSPSPSVSKLPSPSPSPSRTPCPSPTPKPTPTPCPSRSR
ncbi:MAG TPA: hypothetical protein VN860_02580 [Candidatus Acidoferrales bacterium]|nr:hypothetical protein [Candidatus Acidoferrales bacterium]